MVFTFAQNVLYDRWDDAQNAKRKGERLALKVLKEGEAAEKAAAERAGKAAA